MVHQPPPVMGFSQQQEQQQKKQHEVDELHRMLLSISAELNDSLRERERTKWNAHRTSVRTLEYGYISAWDLVSFLTTNFSKLSMVKIKRSLLGRYFWKTKEKNGDRNCTIK